MQVFQICLIVSVATLLGCAENHTPSKANVSAKAESTTQNLSQAKPTLSLNAMDFNQDKNLSDEQLLALAQLKIDDPLNAKLTKNIGRHNGVPVVFGYSCIESCPNFTMKLIYYQLAPKQTCQMVSGVEKRLLIPHGVVGAIEKLCFPKVITDNWTTYQHSYDNFAEVKP